MSRKKNTTVRSSAAVTAALLITAMGAGPAMADHDHGQGKSRDGAQQSAAHRQDGRDHTRGRAGGGADHGAQDRSGDRSSSNRTKTAAAAEKRGSANRGENRGRGDERGNGHTPVTVCHLLGNGGYHLLTMDDNALSAHLGHGDVYPDADGGCPTATAPDEAGAQTDTSTTEQTTTEETTTENSTTENSTTENSTTENSTTEDEAAEAERTGAVVLGEEAFAGTRTGTTVRGQGATVAGAEATRGANRAAPVAGPAAGILPQTGAGAILSGALVAGLGLLAGGAVLLGRRRQSVL